MEIISNEYVALTVSESGAEMTSIVRKSDGREFLWNGDAKYWKRHSPVLFPIVGSLWNGEMRQGGNTYNMSQHGFARDMDFELVKKSESELSYRLVSNEHTRQLYPYDFELYISYRLQGNTIQVCWDVVNTNETEMYFQIGAHPAFDYMDYDTEAEVQGYLEFVSEKDSYVNSIIGAKGCLGAVKETIRLENKMLPITKQTFNNDAIVLEGSQIGEFNLCDANKKPYLNMKFDTPVVGVWSPTHDSYAPFICLEPWYGRCDTENYTGEYAHKDWINRLSPGEKFSKSYTVSIL